MTWPDCVAAPCCVNVATVSVEREVSPVAQQCMPGSCVHACLQSCAVHSQQHVKVHTIGISANMHNPACGGKITFNHGPITPACKTNLSLLVPASQPSIRPCMFMHPVLWQGSTALVEINPLEYLAPNWPSCQATRDSHMLLDMYMLEQPLHQAVRPSHHMWCISQSQNCIAPAQCCSYMYIYMQNTAPTHQAVRPSLHVCGA